VTPERREAAAAFVAESRRVQGLPPAITDEHVVALFAVAIVNARRGEGPSTNRVPRRKRTPSQEGNGEGTS
jgi:hypothetical protein